MTQPRTPTYARHVRFQVSGVFGPVGSAWEIFSYGISVAGPGATEIGENVLLDGCQDLVAFHQRPESHISETARITSIKAAAIMPDGKWLGGVAQVELTGSFPGGGLNPGGLANAPQVACCVTLRTAINNARSRGRMFLPLPNVSSGLTDGLMSAGDAATIAGSARTLVQDLNNLPGFDGTGEGDGVVVASTFGTNTPVTGISVGRVLDTIRSRRNDLREAYVLAAL